MTDQPRSQPTVKSIHFMPQVLRVVDKKSEQSGISRSRLVNYAVAQLCGVRVRIEDEIEEPKRKAKK